jgi:hypothetical protein
LQDHYIGSNHLEDILEIISSDQLMDICQKVYNLFYQEEKTLLKYTKIEKENYHTKGGATQKLENMDEIV